MFEGVGRVILSTRERDMAKARSPRSKAFGVVGELDCKLRICGEQEEIKDESSLKNSAALVEMHILAAKSCSASSANLVNPLRRAQRKQ